jgi:hypothetical protein
MWDDSVLKVNKNLFNHHELRKINHLHEMEGQQRQMPHTLRVRAYKCKLTCSDSIAS